MMKQVINKSELLNEIFIDQWLFSIYLIFGQKWPIIVSVHPEMVNFAGVQDGQQIRTGGMY
jgi:hypothetical protein